MSNSSDQMTLDNFLNFSNSLDSVEESVIDKNPFLDKRITEVSEPIAGGEGNVMDFSGDYGHYQWNHKAESVEVDADTKVKFPDRFVGIVGVPDDVLLNLYQVLTIEGAAFVKLSSIEFAALLS